MTTFMMILGGWLGVAAICAPIIGNAIRRMGGEYFDGLDGWDQ